MVTGAFPPARRPRRGRSVPPESPYLVAAIDYNHNGSLALARRMVGLAADSGAHAVKFSIRRLEGIASETLDAPWLGGGPYGRTHRELWSALTLNPRAMSAVRRAARGRLDFIVAPGDLASFAEAKRLLPDVYQIDPPALTDLALLRAVGRARRPVMLVAGMCTEAAIAAALRALKPAPVALLHMVSAVPLPPDRTALGTIARLRTRFKVPIGYAGWEPGVTWSLVAAALGAVVIEKPFTLEQTLEGPFHSYSLDPAQFRVLARGLRELGPAVAPVASRRVMAEELDVLGTTAQSLVARRRLERGRILTLQDFTLQAPLRGIGPRLWHWVAGRRLLYDLEAGEPITFGVIE